MGSQEAARRAEGS
jgi:hypothetical protein